MTDVPVQMEGLSSSPLHLEKEWLGCPLLPPSTQPCGRSSHQACGCCHCPVQQGREMWTGQVDMELASGIRNGV